MSFHPRIDYATFHRSERKLGAPGEPFVYTPENRARFDEIIARYPPDRKRSAVLPALYLVQDQLGFVTATAMRYVAGLLGITPADVEDVVSFYTMFYTQAGRDVRPAGVPDALLRAQRRGPGDRGAVGEARHRAGPDRCRPAHSRCSRSNASARAIARRS